MDWGQVVPHLFNLGFLAVAVLTLRHQVRKSESAERKADVKAVVDAALETALAPLRAELHPNSGSSLKDQVTDTKTLVVKIDKTLAVHGERIGNNEEHIGSVSSRVTRLEDKAMQGGS